MRIPPERPLPESLVRILRDLTVSLGPSAPPWCVIGATARDLRLYHLENIPTGRATNDVDITILASSWDEFDGIKAKLRGSRRFLDAPPEQPHRVVHHATDTPIDVVPYGGIEERQGRLRWPTRPEVAMSTSGMEEVLRTSTTIEVGDDLAIRIADIPGIVLSKLVAWGDRRAAKDTQDIAALFAAATGIASIRDYVYSAEGESLLTATSDDELCSRALARMTRSISKEQTVAHLARLLSSRNERDALQWALEAALPPYRDPLETAARIVEALGQAFRWPDA